MLMRSTRNRRPGGKERGQVLLFFILAATVAVVIGAAVVDMGLWVTERRHAQGAADMAALAAATELQTSDAATIAEGMDYTKRNGYDDADPSVAVTVTPKFQGNPNLVEVVVNEDSPTFFVGLLGVVGGDIGARAVAKLTITPGVAPCGLCVLNGSANRALDLAGNGAVTVNSNSVYVNSSANQAIRTVGNSTLTATAINVVGKTSGNGYTPAPTTGVVPIVDPLAGVPVPALSGTVNAPITVSGTQTISPGIYTFIKINGGNTLIMSPGIYVMKGDSSGGIQLNSGGGIVGNGVMIYFACKNYPTPCNTNEQGAWMNMAGNGVLTFSAPASGTYKGMALFYDRKNTSPLELTGNAGNSFTGTIYAKSAHLKLTGNGGTSQFNSLIAVDTAEVKGNGLINLNYDPSQNYTPPGVPSISLID